MSSISRLFRVFLMKHCSSTMRCVTILVISFLVLVGLKNVDARTPQAIGPGYSQRNVKYRGCVMPKQPIGGKFEMDSCTGRSCNRTSGEKVASGTFLAFSCDEGYALKGNEFTGCRKGEWYLPPTCVKTCPPLTSRSVDIVYEFQCNGASRDSIIFPGTKATLNCKPFYEIHHSNEPGYRSVTCLESGEWDRPLFDCTAECGKAGGYGLIAGGFEAEGAEFPWHVGIYRERKKDAWEQICGGTLVKPDLVVSAAHCFYDDVMKKIRSVSLFAVAAGKTNRSYSRREHSEQKSSVKEIDIPKKYYGVDVKYALDIAFVRTTTSFTYTGSVRPICIDVDNRNNDLNRARIGKVAGWGIADDDEPSIKLRKIELPYIPHEDCIDAVPSYFKPSVFVDDKFCAGYLNGSSVCEGDSGGGLSFESNGLWYLRGIVSIGPHTQNNDIVCVSDSYTVFTNVSKHLDWIRGFLVGSEAEGRTFCALPEKPLNGGFERVSRSESHLSVSEGEVPNGDSLVFRCDEGYTLEGSIDSTCENGAWSRQAPICVRKCRPLRVPNTVNVVCKFDGKTVPCESDMDAGTEATATCSRFYQISGDHNSTHRDILCTEKGEWDRPVPQCVPVKCQPLGVPNTVNVVCKFQGDSVPCESDMDAGTQATVTCSRFYQISGYHNSTHREILCNEKGEWDPLVLQCVPECGRLVDENTFTDNEVRFPWIVGIYHKRSDTEYEGWGGGTLVSPDLVITDRPTLYNKLVVNSGPAVDVYVGSSENSNYEMSSRVRDVFSVRNFTYKLLDQRDDRQWNDYTHIAILRLATPLTMTTLVRPICIDWGHGYETDDIQLKEKLALFLPEVKDTRNARVPPYLPDPNPTFLPSDECYTFRHFYNYDVGTLTCLRSGLKDGLFDRGQGIFTKSNGIWYLRGVHLMPVWDSTRRSFDVYIHINVKSHIDGIRSVFMQSATSAPMVNQSLA